MFGLQQKHLLVFTTQARFQNLMVPLTRDNCESYTINDARGLVLPSAK